jgi:hypothetical protein
MSCSCGCGEPGIAVEGGVYGIKRVDAVVAGADQVGADAAVVGRGRFPQRLARARQRPVIERTGSRLRVAMLKQGCRIDKITTEMRVKDGSALRAAYRHANGLTLPTVECGQRARSHQLRWQIELVAYG